MSDLVGNPEDRFSHNEAHFLTGLNPAVYEDRIKESWIYPELKAARNVRPSFNTKLGLWGGVAYTGLFYIMGRGKEPWTLNYHGKSVKTII